MAATSVVFFGVRTPLNDADLESLEDRSHPLISSAKRCGLDHYWGNFGAPGERYFLFLGRRIAKLGVEDSAAVQIGADEMVQIVSEVTDRLRQCGISDPPSLFAQFQPDY